MMVDGAHPQINTIRYACYLSRITQSRLTGVFFAGREEEEEITVSIAESAGSVVESVVIQTTGPDPEWIRQESRRIFMEIVAGEQIEADIDTDEVSDPDEFIHKSRFADLLVMDSKIVTEDTGRQDNYLQVILQKAECPVVMAPEEPAAIDTVVFCYNGMKSSVFAIRQFMYLFPELKEKRAKIVSLNSELPVTPEDEKAIASWLRCHFREVEFVATGNASLASFFDYLRRKKNDFVVIGAYGKGLLSSFIETDTQDGIPVNSVPLFIAHY